jgi:serine/threonine protein kinase/formylglycine-generating enzyme required for sulfatase activity
MSKTCEQFERAWKEERRPAIEDYLKETADSDHVPLLWELLALELELRVAAGEKPSAAEYERRFPCDLPTIRALFQTRPGALPERIGRYKVCQRLGGGGFGNVFLCFDERAQRQVAVKVPRAERLTSADAREAFLREARNVARLDHPGIVPLFDIGEEEGQCFLVYKLIEGQSLFERMAQGPVPPAEAAAIVAQVADALHHAHGRNLFHRDIKPGNILLDREGRVYVTDFGLAVPEEHLPRDRGRRSGTYPYMSPEQVRGEGHRIDGRTDIYSLGVVLYELLAGRRAFTGNTAELFDQILYHDVRPPRQIRDVVPRELERICLKAITRQMSARYATARDMAEDLRLVRAALTSSATAAAAPAAAGEPWGDTARQQPISSRPYSPMVPKGLRSFDAEDRDFFLELLPGPRDRDGLPDSLRFWKTRVENRDPDHSFAVGLLYGPSGCGKSSLIKAGLLPRLASDVVPVYVEATPQTTEALLAKGLRQACPALAPNLSLPEMLARLRRGLDLPGSIKVLIVLDQFEQWLHAHGPGTEVSELVAALRHADGSHVQVLLLVRDDFWMGTSRLFDLLEINLDRERNARAVDLFDSQHARRVLTMFGQAFDRLPARMRDLTGDQVKFLDGAVAQLSQDGRIIPVRLSLFADLMKDRPWSTAYLIEVGGAEGVGLRFLEETFTARTALPDLRAMEKPVRALLQALLPESGTDIKGRMRSRQELATACGLAETAPRFARLLEILDRELHIITPTEMEPALHDGPRPSSATTEATAGAPQPAAYYQLTHDYLVPPLRQWLTQEQRRTWRGRAELCLEERTAQFSRTKDTRFLPSAWEYLLIVVGLPMRKRSAQQRGLLRAATRHYAFRAAIGALLVLATVLCWEVIRQRIRASTASGLVTSLLDAETHQVPGIVAQMEDYRHLVNPLLAQALQDPKLDAKQRLHVALALFPTDPSQVDYLHKRLYDAGPQELEVILETLRKEAPTLKPDLWENLRDPRVEGGRRLRAACALAAFDPQDPLWGKVAPDVVAYLVGENLFLVSQWQRLLRPVQGKLFTALQAVFADRTRGDESYAAALVLAEYGVERPEILGELLFTADARQLGAFTVKLPAQGERIAVRLREKLAEQVPAAAGQEARETLAIAQANAAVALLHLGESTAVWPLLRFSPDPRVRTYLMHRCAPGQIDPTSLMRRLPEEVDSHAKIGLILALGEYSKDRLPPGLQDQLRPELIELYRDHPDPGVHSASEWLMRHWHYEPDLGPLERKLISKEPRGDRRWYINSQGHTMALIKGGVKFLMGSPEDEPGNHPGEQQHLEKVAASFAIATKEVTVEQFLRCPKQDHRAGKQDLNRAPTCPIDRVTFAHAARYCLWLSRQEGLREDQLCYEERPDSRDVVPAKGFLDRTGYRLPTEVEWEYACRSGATTSRPFGQSEALLARYAWYFDNSRGRSWPVALLKPNDFGLFDALGNVMEWCHGPNETERIRGGSYKDPPRLVRSASRAKVVGQAFDFVGFRVARTLPKAD